MNDRTCIVTRRAAAPDDLIRFVVGPVGDVVPDIARKLPGRGCWVSLGRLHVDEAGRRKLFARAFRRDVTVPPDLGELVDRLLAKSVLGALGLSRKAGALLLGATQVEKAVRSGKALLVLHAAEAADDGVRKITQARRATVHLGGPAIPAYKLFSQAELGLALGATNVIHAALLGADASRAAEKRVHALDRYRGGSPEDLATSAVLADRDSAAKESE